MVSPFGDHPAETAFLARCAAVTKAWDLRPQGLLESKAPCLAFLAIATSGSTTTGREATAGFNSQLPFRKPLHRALKLHCVETEQTLLQFVVAVVREKLARSKKSA